jgi:ATP-binding cassette subfamily B protein
MFERLQRLGSSWFAQRQQGDVLSRLFSDVGQMEAGVSQALREGLFQLLSLVVSSVVLLTLDPLLGVIVIGAAPVVAVVYKMMGKGAQKRSIALQEELGSVFAVAGENYAGQPVVKAFALESRENARMRQASDRLFIRQLRLQLFGGLFGLAVNGIVTVLRLVVLGLGSWMILEGDLTIGTLVAFMSIMGQVISPVTTLTGLGQEIQAATGSLIRINEVLNAESDIAEDPQAPPLAPLSREIRLN